MKEDSAESNAGAPREDCARVGQCYHPACNNSADWSGEVREAYCSWECAVDARSGGVD